MFRSHEWIEFAAQGIEALAVALMVCFILIRTAGWLVRSMRGTEGAYEHYRTELGKTVLIGLELLVAADIINTVAFALTLTNLELLGALVVVRVALGWTLTVEVEGHWPWQQARESRIAAGEIRRRPLPLNREKAPERDSDAIRKGEK